jgi:hypothetical protein
MPKPPEAIVSAPLAAAALLTHPIRVINVGLDGFAVELTSQGVPVTHVQWSPPAGGDAAMAALLGKLGM